MKTKNLIAIAVASTFGWSAAAFAGPGHQSISSYSESESSQMMVADDSSFDGSDVSSIGSSSHEAGGTVSGSYSDIGSSWGSDDLTLSSLSEEETLALEDGIYSDFYLVSFEPVTVSGWDYYVVDFGDSNELASVDFGESDQLAASDEFWLIPTHELALIPSTEDEMVYELVLVPMFDDMTADLGSDIGEGIGE